jgi:hypothetical protein
LKQKLNREKTGSNRSFYRKCGKCNAKRIGHYHYVSNGVCFACDGEGKIYKANKKNKGVKFPLFKQLKKTK